MEPNFNINTSNGFLITSFLLIIVIIISIGIIFGNFNAITNTIGYVIYGFLYIFIYIYSQIKGLFVNVEGIQSFSKKAWEYFIVPIFVLKEKLTRDEDIEPILKKQMWNYIYLSNFIQLIVIVIIFYILYDAQANSSNLYYYIPIILVPLFLGLYISSQMFIGGGNFKTRIFTLFIFTSLFAFAYCYSYSLNPAQQMMSFSISNYIILLILIIAMAIIFSVFGDYMKRQKGAVGVFIHLLFFIPCLFADFIQFTKNQLHITPNIVYVLFIIELILILFYFYLPKLFHKIIQKNSVLLLNKPTALDSQTIIADSDYFIIKKPLFPDDNTTRYRNNNYSFSMWILINPNDVIISPVNKDGESNEKEEPEETIFSFGNGTTGRPTVKYINSGKNRSNIYRIYATDNPNCSASAAPSQNNCYVELTSLPIQKWNLFIFNYLENQCDIFVNGELIYTIYFDENNVPNSITETDAVYVGNSGGLLNGSICNVNYHSVPLTKFQIVNMYNLYQLHDRAIPFDNKPQRK